MFPPRNSHRKLFETDAGGQAVRRRALTRGPSKLHSSPMKRSINPSSPRPISTGLLRALLRFQIRPINLVVYQGSYSLKEMGELILRSASRLDAFSGYPIRT